jgi:hypothetical protein
MTRYQILIPDTLLDKGLQWPPGASLVEQLECGTAGTHWWLFEDPEAPEDLEGKQVELKLERGPAGDDPDASPVPRIASRRAIVTHLVPQDDSGLMACCGVPAWEVSRSDRITADKELVTCGGAP